MVLQRFLKCNVYYTNMCQVCKYVSLFAVLTPIYKCHQQTSKIKICIPMDMLRKRGTSCRKRRHCVMLIVNKVLAFNSLVFA